LIAILCFNLILPISSNATDKILDDSEQMVHAGEVLTLVQCVAIARKYHPNIITANATIALTNSRVVQAKADYFPHINLQPSYAKSKSAYTGSPDSSYSGAVNLSQNIYDFGRRETNLVAQKFAVQAAQEDTVDAEQTVICAVKVAYFNLLQAQENKLICESTLKQFEAHLTQAVAFFEIGVKPQIEVTKARTDVGSAKLSLIQAQGSVGVAKSALTNAMGLFALPEYSIATTEKTDVSVLLQPLPTVTVASQEALLHRSNWKSMVNKIASLKASLELARNGYYPSIAGTATANYANNEFPLNDSWSAGIALNIPVFDGFATAGKIAEAKANLAITEASAQSLRSQIFTEVEQALIYTQNAQQAIIVAKMTCESADENLAIANGRYNAGLGNPIEISDAILTLNKAKLSYAISVRDYRIAIVTLDRVMGIER
ncbi:MAG: TolC family protein, partial [Deltaproteobacteria bacterium]